nr:hypothetical protein GCM10025732_56050 [Glycomyces mayteni]
MKFTRRRRTPAETAPAEAPVEARAEAPAAAAEPAPDSAPAPEPKQAKKEFPGSAAYWEKRYADGGNSGGGSRGTNAEFKAEVLNKFTAEHGIESVIEFGCGDGEQLSSPSTPLPRVRRVADAAAPHHGAVRRRPHEELCALRRRQLRRPGRVHHRRHGDVARRDLPPHRGQGLRPAPQARLRGRPPQRRPVHRRRERPLAGGRVRPHVRIRPVLKDVEERFPEWRLRERIANPRPWSEFGADGSIADFFIYERAGD